MKRLSPPNAGLQLAALALLAFGTMSLRAEDVYVTTFVSSGWNVCPLSCPYGFDSTTIVLNYSSACPVFRTHCLSGTGSSGTWKVTPALANSHGTYRIFVTKCPANDCSPDIIVSMTTTNGALADASGTTQTNVLTTAFQKANSINSWALVGYITNNTTQPVLFFTYASGGAAGFYMDAIRFQSVDDPSNPAVPARLMQILHSNVVSISGTGPVGHPFALVSSTNLAKSLNLWTPEQTNTDDTGSFRFSVTPGAAKARFFRVITQ